MTHARTLLLAVVALCLSALGLVSAAPTAQADASDDVIRQLDVDMRIDADGRVHVTETYEWDFGTRDGLGLYRHLAQQFDWPDDADLMRVYRYADISVSSPSGAPAEYWITGDGAYLSLDIGAPDGSDDTRTGVQTYELRYTIEGALNPIRDDEEVVDQDELFWNVTGSEWDNTFEQVTTTVSGPTGITDYRCWEGAPNSEDPCGAEVQGSSGTFSSGTLDPGQEQTIAVAFPPGTFTDIDPILVAHDGDVVGYGAFGARVATVTDPIMGFLASFWYIPAAVLAVLYAFGVVRRVRDGRDDHFVGLPPGTFPPAEALHRHPVAPLQRQPPVTVRFTPPDHLAPAVMSRLQAKTSTPHTLVATLMDLAVRGFLTVQEAKTNRRGKPTDWDLILSPRAHERRAELLAHEMMFLDQVFAGTPQVRLKSMRATLPKITKAITKTVTAQVDTQELFTRPVADAARRRSESETTRGRSLAWQVGLLVAAGGVGFLGNYTGALPPSTVSLAWVVTGAVGAWLTLRALTYSTNYRRSAIGRALFEQTRGFKQYLSTAEANQIRFEEGIDVFSRYLPYAIVFGEADRWAKVFEELQAQGRAQVNTGWYVGSHPGAMPNLTSISSAMSSFTSTVSATSGSSGGSGMGGGGGAGGGGGGGGGGGR